MKKILIVSTMTFSIVWTILALTLVSPTLPSNGQRCKVNKYQQEICTNFSYTNLKDLKVLSDDLLNVISVHAIIGSATGFVCGLLACIANKKFNPSTVKFR